MFPLLCFCSMLFLRLFLKAIFLGCLAKLPARQNYNQWRKMTYFLKCLTDLIFLTFWKRMKETEEKEEKKKKTREVAASVPVPFLRDSFSLLCFSWQPEIGGATGSSGLQELRINMTLAFFGRVPGAGNSLDNNITILTFEPCIWKMVSNSFLIPENLR